ncbi:MAG: DUF1080 domain-containing protein [Bacteroidales bacterium]
MKKLLIFALLPILAACNTGRNSDTQQEEWIQLFNGENLDGWHIKIAGYDLNENIGNTFRVEDGMIKVRYDAYDEFTNQFGHIYYDQKFSHYRLRVEYRFVGEQAGGGPEWAIKNSGVMYHSQSPESVLKDQSFPVCLEGQFLGGYNENERPTMNLCTPSTHVHINNELVTQHCISSTSKTIRGEEWVSAEFFVYGDSIIHHLVDGDTVFTFSKPVIDGSDLPEGFPMTDGEPLREGYISLQAESHPVDFRKVELQDLSK